MSDRPPPPPGFVYDDAPAGLLAPGNIDLAHRPRVKNRDGSISTVRSIGVNIDGREVLLPTVSDDGRIMSNREAIETYKRTGKHLGMFDSPAHSTAYAQSLHEDQARMLDQPDGAMPPPPPGFEFVPPKDPYAGQELRNAPPDTLKDEIKKQFWRSTTGGFESWQDASDYFFGTKERNEAKKAGLAVDTSPAEMASGVLWSAGPMLGEVAPMLMAGEAGPAVLRAAPEASGAGAQAARWLMNHPKTVGGVTGALPGALNRSPTEAAIGAALGVAGGKGAEKIKLMQKLGLLPEAPPPGLGPVRSVPGFQGSASTGSMPMEPMAVPNVRLQVPAPEPAMARPGGTSSGYMPEAPLPVPEVPYGQVPGPARPIPMAPEPTPTPPRIRLDPGTAAANAHNAQMAMAKSVAANYPKGGKIWMILDENGAPLEVVSFSEAGAAKARGLPTKFIKKLAGW